LPPRRFLARVAELTHRPLAGWRRNGRPRKLHDAPATGAIQGKTDEELIGEMGAGRMLRDPLINAMDSQ
jgi:hypothetical protein